MIFAPDVCASPSFPGAPAMRRIRTYGQVTDPSGEEVLQQVGAQHERLAARLATVGRIVVVASGKGGVGKSAVAANVAAALAASGAVVGAADADLTGPSLARMLGAAGARLEITADGVVPARGAAGVRVMSMELLLDDGAPLRWRGGAGAPDFLWQSVLEGGALREFLADTVWGTIDVLIIDAPPGTDKLVRLVQLLPRIDALLLVTTPSEAARAVVARSARYARDAGITRIGLVANMTTHSCASCGAASPLFEADGARSLAAAAQLPIWAELPFEPRLAASTDAGEPFVLTSPATPAAAALAALAARLRALPASPAALAAPAAPRPMEPS
jgi:ATP-binding protein involved in chromosome partitioning